jgi:hypothetical protein
MTRWLVLALAVSGVAFAADAPRIQADFVAGPKIDAYKGVVKRGGESACDVEVVTASVDRMPDPAFMRGDEMQELDAQGKVLHTWHVPYESTPLGVDGQRLIVSLTRSQDDPTISVDAQGRLRAAAKPAPLPRSAYSHCPAGAQLPASGYRWCVAMPDHAAPHSSRLVAYEGPCT